MLKKINTSDITSMDIKSLDLISKQHLPLALNSLGVDEKGNLVQRDSFEPLLFAFKVKDRKFAAMVGSRGESVVLSLSCNLCEIPFTIQSKAQRRYVVTLFQRLKTILKSELDINQQNEILYFTTSILSPPVSAVNLIAKAVELSLNIYPIVSALDEFIGNYVKKVGSYKSTRFKAEKQFSLAM